MSLLIPLEPRYRVKKGDTLIKIARRNYKDGRYWKKIVEANPQCKGRIFAGRILRLPSIAISGDESLPYVSGMSQDVFRPETFAMCLAPALDGLYPRENMCRAPAETLTSKIYPPTQALEPASQPSFFLETKLLERSVQVKNLYKIEVELSGALRLYTPEKPKETGIHVASELDVTFENGENPTITNQNGLENQRSALMMVKKWEFKEFPPKVWCGLSESLKINGKEFFELTVVAHPPCTVSLELKIPSAKCTRPDGTKIEISSLSFTITVTLSRPFIEGIALAALLVIVASCIPEEAFLLSLRILAPVVKAAARWIIKEIIAGCNVIYRSIPGEAQGAGLALAP